MTPGKVSRRAHAKVNVFLRVLGPREDGFHEIETLVLPISLHDVVTVRDADGPAPVLDVTGDRAALEGTDLERNLVVRAARALASRVDIPPSVAISLDKRVPVAAGLGGGSADAAATLQALGELWPATTLDDLAAVALELGSDVPAMLAGEPVLASGRGERLVPVHTASTWWVLKPVAFPVRAADAYAWWDADPTTGPDPGALIAALETGDVELLGDVVFNDLQRGVVSRHPEVGATRDAFLEAGAVGAVVSGSGPTVAALARHLGHAETLAAAVEGSIVVSGPPAHRHHPAGSRADRA